MTNLFDLTGKSAVITGGNGGIGVAMAKALTDSGCAVSIWSRNPEKTKRAIRELQTTVRRVHFSICDVCVANSYFPHNPGQNHSLVMRNPLVTMSTSCAILSFFSST